MKLFKNNWHAKSNNQRKNWLAKEINLLPLIERVKNEFEKSLFSTCLDALYTYMVCEHTLNEHKENIQRLTHIVIATFRLTGFSQLQVADHINRIISKREWDFPLPVEILKTINDSSFKEIKSAFFSESDFKNQFNGLINILDGYKHQKGLFIFKLYGVSLEEGQERLFKASFENVSFYACNHPELKILRSAVRKRDKNNKGPKIYSQFFKKHTIICTTEVNFDKLEDGALAAFQIVQTEAKFLFAYLGIEESSIDGTEYLFTESLDAGKIGFKIQLTRRRKALKIPNSHDIDSTIKNAFTLLKSAKSLAAQEILHNEYSHLNAMLLLDPSSYWVYIENIFWDKDTEGKLVKQNFTKLSHKVLPDILSLFNADIGHLIVDNDYMGNYKEIGLTQEQAREIINNSTVVGENMKFDWDKFIPFINHDFLSDLINLFKTLSSRSSVLDWEKYFSNLAQELYEYRNALLHSGITNNYSRIKFTSILPFLMNRLRWTIINYAIENPAKPYSEVIKDLIGEPSLNTSKKAILLAGKLRQN